MSSAAVLVVSSLWLMSGATGTIDVGVVPELGPAVGSYAPQPSGLLREIAHPFDQVEVRRGSLEELRPTTKRAPVRLSIPALGIDAPVVPTGVERSGNTQVPKDVGTVGWYRFGPSPGSGGSAVLIGHVDSRVQGPGVFFRLASLSVGDVATVTMEAGRPLSFRVVARRSFRKALLPGEIFAREGRPVLVFVTCGGSFDDGARRYSDNVVVYAVPRIHGSAGASRSQSLAERSGS